MGIESTGSEQFTGFKLGLICIAAVGLHVSTSAAVVADVAASTAAAAAIAVWQWPWSRRVGGTAAMIRGWIWNSREGAVGVHERSGDDVGSDRGRERTFNVSKRRSHVAVGSVNVAGRLWRQPLRGESLVSSGRFIRKLTYFPIIFLNAVPNTLHGNTLTSFSIFLGFGLGNDIMSLKKSSQPSLDFDTVIGLNPSRLRRILFFSSTEKRTPTNASSR